MTLIHNLNIPTEMNRNRSLLCKCTETKRFITIPFQPPALDDLPLEIVLRSAGLLPASQKLSDDQQHMLYLYNSLVVDKQKYVIKFMQALRNEK